MKSSTQLHAVRSQCCLDIAGWQNGLNHFHLMEMFKANWKEWPWIRPLSLIFHTWLLAKAQCSFSPSLERHQWLRVNIETGAWNLEKLYFQLFWRIMHKWIFLKFVLIWIGLWGTPKACYILQGAFTHPSKERFKRCTNWNVGRWSFQPWEELSIFTPSSVLLDSADLPICICNTDLFGYPFMEHSIYYLCNKYDTIVAIT